MGSQFRRLIVAGMTLTVAIGMMPIREAAYGEMHAGWRGSFEEAEVAAENSGRPLLIHFQAWYCGPCRQMDSQVFAHAEVQEALQRGIVSVQVDVTKVPELATRFDATTVPRDVVLFPDGTGETLNVGFLSRQAYLKLLSDVAARGLKYRKPPAQDSIQESHPEKRRSDHELAVDQTAPRTIIGLDGYCPVRLINNREWVKGKESVSEEFRGLTYHFAAEAERQEFVERPVHFAPQNLGCDPVLLLSAQKAISGRIEYGAFFDERLYLFSTLDNKNEFKKNPLKFTRIQHAIRIEDIRGSRIQ